MPARFPLHFTRALPMVLVMVGLVACKTQRTVSTTREEVDPIKKKFAGNFQLGQDEQGMVRVQSDRRSDFESRSFSGTSTASVGKEVKKSTFGTKAFQGKTFEGSKPFSGSKDYTTTQAKEQGQKSRLQMPWNFGGKKAREADKDYDTGEAIERVVSTDAERVYSTREDPKTRDRWRYPDEAINDIRSPSSGSGPGPTIRDVRGFIGKDD
ncbi:MAG: hypothetical protein ACKO2G_13480 [Verrucomicrobiales bacterium]